MTDLPPLPTVGAIAERLNVSQREVERVVRVRGIRPVARAGSARVFSLAAVDEIRAVIKSGKSRGGRS